MRRFQTTTNVLVPSRFVPLKPRGIHLGSQRDLLSLVKRSILQTIGPNYYVKLSPFPPLELYRYRF